MIPAGYWRFVARCRNAPETKKGRGLRRALSRSRGADGYGQRPLVTSTCRVLFPGTGSADPALALAVSS
jgi:hypothetical protein